MLDLAVVALIVSAVCIGGFWMRRGVVERAQRLNSRGTMEDGRWFDSFLPDASDAERRALKEVLCLLAKDLEIHWTCLRPTDRFAQELRFKRRYLDSEPFITFEDDFATWCEEHQVRYPREQQPPPDLGTFLTTTLDLLREKSL